MDTEAHFVLFKNNKEIFNRRGCLLKTFIDFNVFFKDIYRRKKNRFLVQNHKNIGFRPIGVHENSYRR